MITIIGAGRVGSSAAMRIADLNIDDVLLVDIVEGLPMGEALDIGQSCNFDVDLRGSNNFQDIKGSDLVINTAGLAREPGMNRLDLTRKNFEITKSIGEKLKRYAAGTVLMQVANPVDLMALAQLKVTGFPSERVIAMGNMLDTLRFSYFIAKEAGVSPAKVESLVLGEHGDSMAPAASQAKIEGKPIKEVLDQKRIDSIIERTGQAGGEVIKLKGSTFYAPSQAIAILTEAIIKDKKTVHPTSAYLQGEYGVSGVYAGVPARLGKGGLEEIVELDLDDNELSKFRESCSVLKGKAKELGLL
ncbi:MAG: malate dehydrogenase [Candidatus Aenigmatarchaeota archaeon]|nr:MAG: malate dehydrogenase [Candidatus Aenigmarchaeota archaeon]